jgi:hypothetical protein
MAGLAVAAATVATMTVANASTEGTVPVGPIRAAAFTEQSGARVETTVDVGGGQDVGWLASGDWMRYNGIDLGPAGTLTTSVRVAAAYADRPGTVEVRIDSTTGQLPASITIRATGGWQSWVTTPTAARPPVASTTCSW